MDTRPPTPLRLTRRGRVLLTTVVVVLSLAAGMTADAWNPCAGDHVCVLVGTR